MEVMFEHGITPDQLSLGHPVIQYFVLTGKEKQIAVMLKYNVSLYILLHLRILCMSLSEDLIHVSI
jgi:hypothetical protein